MKNKVSLGGSLRHKNKTILYFKSNADGCYETLVWFKLRASRGLVGAMNEVNCEEEDNSMVLF